MASNQESLVRVYNIDGLNYSNYKYELSTDVKPSFMKSLTNDVSVELESLNKDSIVLNIKNTSDSNIEEASVSVLGIDASNNPVDMSSESISKKLNSEENDYVTINIDTDNIFKLKCFANASTSDDSETPSSDKVNNNVFEFSIRDELSSILSIDEMENIKLLEDKQGKAMNNGMFTLDDNWLYGLSFEAGNPIFVKMRLDGSDYTVLAEAAAENVCIKDGNIYFSTGDQRVGESRWYF